MTPTSSYAEPGISQLPYTLELGDRLRAQSVTKSRPIWMRLCGGHQELYAAWPEQTLRLKADSLNVLDSRGDLVSCQPADRLWAMLRKGFRGLKVATPSPYKGGWIGILGYDLSRPNHQLAGRLPFPDALFGDYRRFVFIDHRRQTAEMVTLSGYSGPLDDWTVKKYKCDEGHALTDFTLTQPFQPLTEKARYLADLKRIHDWLMAGDCYQVNYAQAFHAKCSGASATAMTRLLELTKAPHAAWMSAPEGDVLSLSPELFLSASGGKIVTKPIKGTAPRSSNALQDVHLREELARSMKNRAENLMIVDLLRHDFGRHAATGSVKVDKLFEVETLPQVHHLVSTVSATIAPDADVIDVIRDSFPGGSITGAPKKRAMEIISTLEPTPRSVYCGSIGFISANGDAEFNIAIRTLLRVGKDLYAWAGGGIVADSDPESEYDECFHKIGALMSALEKE